MKDKDFYTQGKRIVLLADSGSTKTDWCVAIDGKPVYKCKTSGINPAHQGEAQIRKTLAEELLANFHAEADSLWRDEAEHGMLVNFYGAGCKGANAEFLRALLAGELAVEERNVLVDSDLMAAAKALCFNEEGIACILGTGANSCVFDGEKIVANVPPLGYILGDEGSGAVMGKLLVNAMFKGELPESLVRDFKDYVGLDLDGLIHRVYKEPLANRFLASLSVFVHDHLDCQQIEAIVVDNFNDFFRKNIDRYGRMDLPVNAVGSIAYHFRKQLEKSARRFGYEIGTVLQSPMEGLVKSVG